MLAHCMAKRSMKLYRNAKILNKLHKFECDVEKRSFIWINRNLLVKFETKNKLTLE